MTFRPTPFTPYDTSDWTAAKECNDVSHDVARERAPRPGVSLNPNEPVGIIEGRDVEFVDDWLDDDFEADLERWEAAR